MSTGQWLLMNPEGETRESRFATRGRTADLDGRTVGLFWNGKPGGDVFLDEVARELAARFRDLRILKMWEARPETRISYGNSAENLRFMAQSADLVIASSAD